MGGELTLAWRLFDRLAVAISAGYEDVQVGRGEADTERDLPFTVDVFPDLQGIEEGQELYHCRAGIKGTISQGVRAFGMRRTRYRGLDKTITSEYPSSAHCTSNRYSRGD